MFDSAGSRGGGEDPHAGRGGKLSHLPFMIPTCCILTDVASSVGGFDGECGFSDIEGGWSARAVYRLLRHTNTRRALHDAGAGGVRECKESAAKSQKGGSTWQER